MTTTKNTTHIPVVEAHVAKALRYLGMHIPEHHVREEGSR